MKNFDVILIGNGLGRGEYAEKLLEAVLNEAEVPVVVDADGLFALIGKEHLLRKGNVILTPHSMEMARL